MALDFLAITNIARANGLTLSPDQQELIKRFTRSLLEWNAKINLISRRDEENIWTAHILHSLSLLFMVNIPTGAQLIDLGSGGGLPGIPLAIARPDLHIVLLDSIAKKVRAVGEIVRDLQLRNVEALCGRAEEIGVRSTYRHRFDIVVARAVAPLADLVRWGRPLLKQPAGHRPQFGGGREGLPADLPVPYLVAMKGGDLQTEIDQAKIKAGVEQLIVLSLRLAGGPVEGLEDKKILVVAP
jgi:16S rRNA (guanine527-N7)-methyltransferase